MWFTKMTQSQWNSHKMEKATSGKITSHSDIIMFYVADIIHWDECMAKYCATDDMMADYNTKSLVGNKFKGFRDLIMNLTGVIPQIGQQECVRHNQSSTNRKKINFWKFPSRANKTKIKTRESNERKGSFFLLKLDHKHNKKRVNSIELIECL